MQEEQVHTEQALLVQVANGDETAFRQLYDHYRKKLYAYAFQITESALLADEVVQEVFLKLWVHRQKLLEVKHFNSWLYTIARNHLLDALKKTARETLARKELVRTIPAAINNADDRILFQENEKLLQQALNQLSTQQQLIYHLSRNQGMKYDEIASELNIAPNTVKVHIVNALRSIRKYIRYHSVSVFLLCSYFTCLIS